MTGPAEAWRDSVAGRLYWSAVILFSLLYLFGVRIISIEAVLVSFFVSAAAAPLLVFLRSLQGKPSSYERGISILVLLFSLWAVGMLIALLHTLGLFTLDLPNIAAILAFSAAGLAAKRYGPDFSPLLDSFAVASLYLIIQQPPLFLRTSEDDVKIVFFHFLAFFFMGLALAYKLRRSFSVPALVFPAIALPLASLYLINVDPPLVGLVSVIFLALSEILRKS